MTINPHGPAVASCATLTESQLCVWARVMVGACCVYVYGTQSVRMCAPVCRFTYRILLPPCAGQHKRFACFWVWQSISHLRLCMNLRICFPRLPGACLIQVLSLYTYYIVYIYAAVSFLLYIDPASVCYCPDVYARRYSQADTRVQEVVPHPLAARRSPMRCGTEATNLTFLATGVWSPTIHSVMVSRSCDYGSFEQGEPGACPGTHDRMGDG